MSRQDMKLKRPLEDWELNYISLVFYVLAAAKVVSTLTTFFTKNIWIDLVFLVGFLPRFIRKGSRLAWFIGGAVSALYVGGYAIVIFSPDSAFGFGGLSVSGQWLTITMIKAAILCAWVPCLYLFLSRKVGPPMETTVVPNQPSQPTPGGAADR